MSTTTFETAKIGDKVFSHTFGWGEVECIDSRSFFPVEVRFYESGVYETFTLKGYCYDNLPTQSLFWNEVDIEAPIKPVGIKVVNGIEIPDISFNPEHGEQYYMPWPTSTHAHHSSIFQSCEEDYYRRDNNLCYPFTEEGKQAAIAHAKAMLGITTT
jgi:hypothetical protein